MKMMKRKAIGISAMRLPIFCGRQLKHLGFLVPGGSLASFPWLQMRLNRAVITCDRTRPQTCLGKNLFSLYLEPVFALLTRS